jgi:UDP-N-acetylmuramyl pentapeptide phosphotransferase/UDP-N-acetylglucosamine-1-phosphate transferase
LIAGLAVGSLLLIAGVMHLNSFQACKSGEKTFNAYESSRKLTTILSIIICAVLTFVMFNRYQKTAKFMPAGLIAGAAAVMALYLSYRLFSPVQFVVSAKSQ